VSYFLLFGYPKNQKQKCRKRKKYRKKKKIIWNIYFYCFMLTIKVRKTFE